MLLPLVSLRKVLARRGLRSITTVVVDALEAELARTEKRGNCQKFDEVMALTDRTAALLDHVPEDPTADLYDERGLPKRR